MQSGDILHNTSAGTPHVYVQYKGIFDMQDVYESIIHFLREKKFKVHEKQHRYRKPGPFGAEILHQFEATRHIEDFYEWTVTVYIETFDLHDVEVVTKAGEKKKMQKGKFWMQLYGRCETDPDKVWEGSAFMAHLKSFYLKYVVRKKYEGVWWDELYYKVVLRLHALVRERLKMASEVNETRQHGGTH
jgi:hypothetical protein